ncbi:NADP-dependent oxidoreductase [Halalkalibacillus sediminis]|uniref:NADP-dependent oxidoreductase n=1 Tax=Halalkalibacillus sediminis TaxID=2018042 RepID=A0A2I0QUU5_9BACI|nr:NADP-dependent oxidoreductase [Halalkalibacillus sediminis]PKR78123.1 NADP-dependent oxidoreductase [Halalkalibacillus sediminis]
MNKNKQILLAKRPEGTPDKNTFKFVETDIRTPEKGEILIRTIYVSVDPYMRGRMVDAPSYIPPYQIDDVLGGGAIGEVVESKSDRFEHGDIVLGSFGWQSYYTAKEDEVRKIDKDIAPISTHLGILGLTGLTAYFGLLDIGEPKEGETVVISGAAGAVGSVVGQIAKIKGARVVGIAGTDEKNKYLKEELNFDEAINYKTSSNLQQDIAKACPNGVDVYFDNVGGEISDAVHVNINKYARITVCGAISSYNLEGKDVGPRIQTTLIKKSAKMQGFTLGDYTDRFGEGSEALAKWLNEGKLKYEETIKEGFDHIPDAFLDLFEGNNIGKLLVKVDK